MKLTETYLRTLYSKLVSLAQKAERRGKIDNANRYLTAAANLAYIFYLSYRDNEADELVKKISCRIVPIAKYEPALSANRCVFLDSFSVYNAGLTIQYMRAIEAAGWDVLYLSSQNMNLKSQSELRDIILSNPRAQIVSIPHSKTGTERLQFMYDTIVGYQPSNVFIHMSPFAPYFAEVCHALPSKINKYLVDYTDHSFLLGADCADYTFEFRNKGVSIAIQHRGYKEDQILHLPFYPNIFNNQFQGLPAECEGKKIILSGGNYWKIMDGEGTFFKMSKAILDANPDSVIIYAGMGQDAPVRTLISNYEIGDRFLLLGWRMDIGELFDRADVFLTTYPACGGLMGVYAGIKSKPILALLPPIQGNNTETTVCTLDNYPISKNTIEEVVEESVKILNNPEYAKEIGSNIHRCCVDKEWFDSHFKLSVETKINQGPVFFEENCEISQHSVENAIVYNNDSGVWRKSQSRYLGWLVIFVEPSFVVDAIKSKIKNAESLLESLIK